MSFNELRFEQAVIELLQKQGFSYSQGKDLSARRADKEAVLLEDDLSNFLQARYKNDSITDTEIASIILQLNTLPASDLYESNKRLMKWVSDGFLLKREDRSLKDLYIQLIDYAGLSESREPREDEVETLTTPAAGIQESKNYAAPKNIYRVVNQLEIEGRDYGTVRIPDVIVYINGLPLVVFELKSAVRENSATLHDAYVQLATRYRRDIPQLFVYNAFCVVSDGVNSKMGTLFSPYDFFYSWRKVDGTEVTAAEGINALHTMIKGLFHTDRLREVIRHFIFFPDVTQHDIKIACRYPQYYAATKLFDSVRASQKPKGNGKGGTYFGSTGCGKSYTMQFLTRLLMKSAELASPTIVLITDRTDLDDQLSGQFGNAKRFIGDNTVVSIKSRAELRELLQNRNSGGVFLTTIHKFTEDTQLLTERSNVICISDEAHRSQTNLDQKVSVTERGVSKSYGFAKYLHDSLPNATYVGFTGTPVDATLDVFGDIVDSYTMNESVQDNITVRIVYEGRAAKVLIDSDKLSDIEAYYQQCEADGSSEYQVEESKKALASMTTILGDPDRIKAIAEDFVEHYETRVAEGATVAGKAMFVCAKRDIAWQLYQELQTLRPEWFESRVAAPESKITEEEAKKLPSLPYVNMVMTRNKDDNKTLYDLLGDKSYRQTLDQAFKNEKSNFKIAIVVDMWLTGFDVPFLDTMYIDKPVSKHNLIQTISRVNRKYKGKNKGLVVDYIGIKKQMNLALAQYNRAQENDIEAIDESIVTVRDHLDLLNKAFHSFDRHDYFFGSAVEQLDCLNQASEFVLLSEKRRLRFMGLVKRMKAAYDICCGSDAFSDKERSQIHFYLAVRSIVFKLTKGEAPDTAQMNAKVAEMIAEAIKSDGVEEIFKLDENGNEAAIDIFDDAYLEKIENIKLPNTKIQLLQKLLAKAIEEFSKTNRAKGVDFSKRFNSIVEKYNERDEESVLVGSVLDDFADQLTDMITQIKDEFDSGEELGISFEEKAFYDILKQLAVKYDFTYPEDKLLILAKEVKEQVDDKARYTDWARRDDIKAQLKVDLILLLHKHGYPPVDRDEVYQEIFEQAKAFKASRMA